MAESNSVPTSNTLCLIAAILILLVGMCAFTYVGQQMRHGSSTVNTMILSPSSSVTFAKQTR